MPVVWAWRVPIGGGIAQAGNVWLRRPRPKKSTVSATVERKVDVEAAATTFVAGDRVSHKTFGPGTVISAAGDMIEVQFERSGQTKKLMKGFAPIVKLV